MHRVGPLWEGTLPRQSRTSPARASRAHSKCLNATFLKSSKNVGVFSLVERVVIKSHLSAQPLLTWGFRKCEHTTVGTWELPSGARARPSSISGRGRRLQGSAPRQGTCAGRCPGPSLLLFLSRRGQCYSGQAAPGDWSARSSPAAGSAGQPAWGELPEMQARAFASEPLLSHGLPLEKPPQLEGRGPSLAAAALAGRRRPSGTLSACCMKLVTLGPGSLPWRCGSTPLQSLAKPPPQAWEMATAETPPEGREGQAQVPLAQPAAAFLRAEDPGGILFFSSSDPSVSIWCLPEGPWVPRPPAGTSSCFSRKDTL